MTPVRGPLFRLVVDLPEEQALCLDGLLATLETPAYSVYDAGGLWRVEVMQEGVPDDDTTAAFERLVREAGGGGRFRVEPVPDRDWLAENRRQFAPIAVGRYFIHGTLTPVRPPVGTRVIQLDAGLAFGTGRHATTALCLTAMDRLARRRSPVGKVLDLGTGAGILAIAAAKTWPAAAVLASDIDPIAVDIARDNARRNGVAARITAIRGDGPGALGGGFDLMFANILLGPLLSMAGDLADGLAPDGVAVLSGLLEAQVPAALARYRHHGLYLGDRLSKDGWAALILSGRVG